MARSVVRIQTPGQLGSGFMIAEDLVMTNNHVIADAAPRERAASYLTFSSTERARLLCPSSRMPTGLAYSIPARWPTTTPRQVSWITP